MRNATWRKMTQIPAFGGKGETGYRDNGNGHLALRGGITRFEKHLQWKGCREHVKGVAPDGGIRSHQCPKEDWLVQAEQKGVYTPAIKSPRVTIPVHAATPPVPPPQEACRHHPTPPCRSSPPNSILLSVPSTVPLLSIIALGSFCLPHPVIL